MKCPQDMIAGSVFHTKCGELFILKYTSYNNVLVKFKETGHQRIAESSHIRSGRVRDPILPSVYGVGFIGVGDYKSKNGSKNTREYDSWSHMMTRCYDSNYKAKKETYSECAVCEEWHNFQNFAEWYHNNYPADGEKYCLDKDLKVIGNKVYSPDMCMFVSNLVNVFITDSGKTRGPHPIGVTKTPGGRFVARCSNPIAGSSDYLGTFDSELNAHLEWRRKKSEIAGLLMINSSRSEEIYGLSNYKSALDNFDIHN